MCSFNCAPNQKVFPTPMQSNGKISYSKPIPFQWQNAKPHSIPAELAILEASHAFLLTCSVFRQFEPSLGTGTKAVLHQQSRVTRQVS